MRAARACRWLATTASQALPRLVSQTAVMNNTNLRLSRWVRTILLTGGAAVVIGASTLGFGAYSYLKPTASASGPIESVPLTDTAFAQGASTGSSATIYDIQPSASQASFTVDEVLRGSPYTVVGTTNQVSGQIALDGSDPRDVQVGTILVDARTLATDDSSRNRALGNQILSTSEYEYISFTPTQFTGLPDSVTTGQPFTFQATGDLTIRGVTKPATFDVTVTPSVDGSLDGSAITTIQYADWGVSIPNVPFVASVDKDVQLAFDFTAIAAA